MAGYPLHPRLARVMVEGARRGVVEDAAVMCAILGERDLRTSEEQRARAGAAALTGDSDLTDAVELFAEARRARFAEGALRGLGVNPGAAQAVSRASAQIAAVARTATTRGAGARVVDAAGRERELRVALLAGFPDRVARRRRPGSAELLLSGGGTAELAPSSIVREAQLLVAVDVEERQAGITRRTQVRAASAIEADWLIDVGGDALREERVLEWNVGGERVEVVARLRYDAIVLDESRKPFVAGAGDPAEDARAAALLGEAALAAGVAKFADPDAVARWIERVRFARAHDRGAQSAAGGERAGQSAGGDRGAQSAARGDRAADGAGDPIREALVGACEGAASFADLRETSLLDRLRAGLSPRDNKLLAENAPDRVTLPGGRSVKIEYEPGKPPWIASRLQDFFGLAAGPAVAGGRVPLVLHLLAPNQRAVQVTTDLAGFWDRHYPAIRKELMRKYPRHSWPEDPRTAQPPAPRPPRR